MSPPALLRELRGYPRIVATLAALAVAIGVLSAFRVSGDGLESRRQEVGYARAAAVVDTRPSQVTDANAAGGAINELTNRAKLIADLMTRSPLRDEIADRAGVPRDHLLTERPMNGLERRLTLPEVSRATVGTGDREASLLRVGVTPLLEGESPIIGIDVRAPDPARAARLADAAMAAARDYLEQTEAAESPERPLDIQPLAPATGESAVIGPSPVFALLVAVGAFGLGCAATLAGGRLRAGLRREPARA